MPQLDRTIAALARRQAGAFSLAQARDAGFTDHQVRRRVAEGRWDRPVRGVLVLCGTADDARRRATVASLARPDGAVSHLSAAALLGLGVPAPPLPVLTVPPGTSARTPVAHVRRLPLPPELVVRQGAVRLTAPARTIVDCATVLGPRLAGRLVDEALHDRLVTVAQVEAALDGSRHVRGRAREVVLGALDVWAGPIRLGSAGEARLLRQLRSWGLPEPARQVPVRDGSGRVIARLDAGWPELRLGLEYDSTRWHGPLAWAHDEERHAALEALGWQIERVDKADLVPGQTGLRRRLVAAHAARSAARPDACA
jgi:hypothetical protein